MSHTRRSEVRQGREGFPKKAGLGKTGVIGSTIAPFLEAPSFPGTVNNSLPFMGLGDYGRSEGLLRFRNLSRF
jgi:hypothetical protein